MTKLIDGVVKDRLCGCSQPVLGHISADAGEIYCFSCGNVLGALKYAKITREVFAT